MNETYKKNIEIIKERLPELYSRITGNITKKTIVTIFVVETEPLKAPYEIIKGKNKTISVDGKLFHSQDEAEKEAQEELNKYDIIYTDKVMLFGCGLGYIIKPLLEKTGVSNTIIIIEKDINIFKEALKTNDFSELMESRVCMIFVGGTIQDIINAFHKEENVGLFAMHRNLIIKHEPSMIVFEKYYYKVLEEFRSFMIYANTTIITGLTLPFHSMPNEINNLIEYYCNPGVKELENKMKKLPAIIVSAGPSLAKNINQLKKLQHKAIIIAVSTTYKLLVSKGIIPHFTTMIDYHQVSKRYHEGVEKTNTILIARNCTSPEAITAFKGKIIFHNDITAANLLNEAHEEKGVLRMGATVAHLAFFVAEHIGCDPIIFIGQDLSHPDGITHAPGSAIFDEWYPEFNRFQSPEMKEWEMILRMRMALIPATDINGNKVYSDSQMFAYYKLFSLVFNTSNRKIINCTEGGMLKDNCEIMTLANCAEKYTKELLPINTFDFLKKLKFNDEAKKAKLKNTLEIRLKECALAREYYKEAMKYLKRAKKHIGNRDKRGKNLWLAKQINDKFIKFEHIAKTASTLMEFHKYKVIIKSVEGRIDEVNSAFHQNKLLDSDIEQMSVAVDVLKNWIEPDIKKVLRRMK